MKFDQMMFRKFNEGKLPTSNQDNQQTESCVFIQKFARGILARKKIQAMRYTEMEFLGMKRKTVDDDPFQELKVNDYIRKGIQEGN